MEDSKENAGKNLSIPSIPAHDLYKYIYNYPKILQQMLSAYTTLRDNRRKIAEFLQLSVKSGEDWVDEFRVFASLVTLGGICELLGRPPLSIDEIAYASNVEKSKVPQIIAAISDKFGAVYVIDKERYISNRVKRMRMSADGEIVIIQVPKKVGRPEKNLMSAQKGRPPAVYGISLRTESTSEAEKKMRDFLHSPITVEVVKPFLIEMVELIRDYFILLTDPAVYSSIRETMLRATKIIQPTSPQVAEVMRQLHKSLSGVEVPGVIKKLASDDADWPQIIENIKRMDNKGWSALIEKYDLSILFSKNDASKRSGAV